MLLSAVVLERMRGGERQAAGVPDVLLPRQRAQPESRLVKAAHA